MSDNIRKTKSFQETSWSRLDRLHSNLEEERRRVYDYLAETYRAPLFSLLVTWGLNQSDAEDLVQSFFESAILSDLFSKADRTRGRFRSFLIASLRHHWLHDLRAKNTQTRMPRGGIISLDQEGSDIGEPLAPSAGSPERALEVAWMRVVLCEALKQFEVECERKDARVQFSLFYDAVFGPELDGTPDRMLKDLAAEVGLSEVQASNLLTTAKRNFRRLILKEIAKYSLSDYDIHEEFQVSLGYLGIRAR